MKWCPYTEEDELLLTIQKYPSTGGDRKDAWIMNDLMRRRCGLRPWHDSSRRVLNAMREGDRTDAQIMASL